MKRLISTTQSIRVDGSAPCRAAQSDRSIGGLNPMPRRRSTATLAESLENPVKKITMKQPDPHVPLARATGIDDPGLYVSRFVANATHWLGLTRKRAGAMVPRTLQ